MTDRFHSLTVVLEHDMHADDAMALCNAIRQFRNVLSVEGNVSDYTLQVAQLRVRREMMDKLHKMICS